jgi:hypothetical protein
MLLPAMQSPTSSASDDAGTRPARRTSVIFDMAWLRLIEG